MSGDPEDLIAYSVDAARVLGSPGYPAEENRLQRRVRADFERGFYPQGVARQLAAIVADGDRRAPLKRVTAPTLVVPRDARSAERRVGVARFRTSRTQCTRLHYTKN